ncbi:Ni/Fe hydrogenase subunit alpha [candidate division WOR-3 bacterium]|uniref:Ni/Fe hydrogenase subunit alpha n=1 Tax=candidate division WOR-3 bacterium TaxID=2052148 RepID=A0A660SM38_UNCW3|nr:MAG: Ni/Fe hydrogenase subunit alpha [candidate division WOR-3 bacterium]
MRRVTIDPITRLEGHGRIEIFLDDAGNVERAFFQVPELRGFEKFSEGRLAEEMPRITPKICGVCPTAHHMCSTKTLDDLYKVKPTPTAEKIRRFMYNCFMFEDHMLHFYILAGPDFIVGPDAPKAERNVLGVIAKVGLEIGGRLIDIRKKVRDIISYIGGRVIHPVCGLPGGVSKPIEKEKRSEFEAVAREALEFAKFTIQAFEDIVLKNKTYVDIITGDVYYHKTYYMGLVDEKNKVNFYDGMIRVVDPDGEEFCKFDVHEYQDHIGEHVEPWSYIKFPFLKKVGWKGFVDGKDSGIYRVAPLARLNAADGMATPLAQAEYERMFDTLGGKPVHHTLAFHWARIIEALFAAERMVELITDPEITGSEIRNLPTETPVEGIGVIEAPRGTLYHHYQTDERGRIKAVNLIVATLNNSAAICMSVERAAKGVIKEGKIDDGILNMVEMAFRAYDPCLACATHAIGQTPLIVTIRSKEGKILKVYRRD